MSAGDVMQLQQPLEKGGIRSVNFFNGRLLSSKDLTREQAARRESDWRLGLALGDGVAFGLEVATDAQHNTEDEPVLEVKAGLAINRKGQALRLVAPASVALKRRFDAVAESCLFAECKPIAGGTYLRGAGVYVLTIAPAELGEGRAPTNGLDPTNVRCNTDATVEAVQFRLVALNPLRYTGLDPANPQFRNRLAYRFFGIEARELSYADPWRDDPAAHGLLETLRHEGLSDHDVPLALVYWTSDGIQFIDAWAVRRGITPRELARGRSQFLGGKYAANLGEAMRMQFQAHLVDVIAAAAVPTAVNVHDHFRHLPPVGILPLESSSRPRGVAIPTFLAGCTYREPVHIEGARLLPLLMVAGDFPAFDLTSKEMIWLYLVRQNRQAVADSSAPKPPYALFASGQLPFFGDARFDVNRWDFSNYGSPLIR